MWCPYFPALTSALIVFAAGTAWSEATPPSRTAETLMEACMSEDKTAMMRCTAYLAGVADSMDFLTAFQRTHGAALSSAKLTLKPFGFCHDQPWTSETLRRAFVDWTQANPKRRQDDQYVAAVDALHNAFPCK